MRNLIITICNFFILIYCFLFNLQPRPLKEFWKRRWLRKQKIIVKVVYNPENRIVFDTIKMEFAEMKDLGENTPDILLDAPDLMCPNDQWYIFYIDSKILEQERAQIEIIKTRDKNLYKINHLDST